MMQLRQMRFDIRHASRQILILLGLFAAINGLFFAFFTRPAVREYRELLEASQGGFDALAEREAQTERLETFRDGLERAAVDLQTLRDDVLSTRDIRLVEVHAEIAALAARFSIDLNSVGFSNELLLSEDLDRLAISLPLEGGYVNLRKFLEAVEASDKFLLVERVALAKGKRGGVLLDLNISLATYFNAPKGDWNLPAPTRRRRR